MRGASSAVPYGIPPHATGAIHLGASDDFDMVSHSVLACKLGLDGGLCTALKNELSAWAPKGLGWVVPCLEASYKECFSAIFPGTCPNSPSDNLRRR